ncbi:hypothetical protein BDZ97DRAFT_920167 [Flammula alnicola]|nr:hypothetical protein BDZ97DRAFT_920167 [Flammula alnicola]
MHFFASFVLAVSAFVSVASAANFSVIVGQDTKNLFAPTSLTGVAIGDLVSFKFISKNHTVTQSSFTTPCVAKQGGVDSGFIPVATNATAFPEWTIKIDNVTAPLWFYCMQGTHCRGGMVFAINPTADKSFEAFLANAQGTTTTTTNTSTPTTSGGTTTASTTGTTAAGSGAFSLSVQKATTLLAALGLIASLTL